MTIDATGVRGYTNLGTFFSGAGRYHARFAIFRKPAHVLRFRLLMEFPRHLNSFSQIIGLEPAKLYGWTIRRWESGSNKDGLAVYASCLLLTARYAALRQNGGSGFYQSSSFVYSRISIGRSSWREKYLKDAG
jgi:hypothetical protein